MGNEASVVQVLSSPIQAVERIVEGDVAGAAAALATPIQTARVGRIAVGGNVAGAAAAVSAVNVVESAIPLLPGFPLGPGPVPLPLPLPFPPSIWDEVQELFSLSSSTSGERRFGPFILALLFSEYQLYIKVVREALIEEARCESNDLDQKVFVPGSDIDDQAWAETKVKVYVVSQYGNYIDQDHTSVHKGIIIAYEDQSHKSEKFALHRFELDAENEDDYKKLKEHVEHRHDRKQGAQIRARASIPSTEYAEEFYYRSLMKTDDRSAIPGDLLNVLVESEPSEVVKCLI